MHLTGVFSVVPEVCVCVNVKQDDIDLRNIEMDVSNDIYSTALPDTNVSCGGDLNTFLLLKYLL